MFDFIALLTEVASAAADIKEAETDDEAKSQQESTAFFINYSRICIFLAH